MELTIGMASYNNAEQVWWTIQALRVYHDLTDCEIIIIDNYGDDKLKKWCDCWGGDLIKYIEYKEVRGTANSRNQVFKTASGKFVLCIDSHVMLFPKSIELLKQWIRNNPDSPDLIQGPLVFDGLDLFVDRMKPEWKCNMFGVWGDNKTHLPEEPYEIPMHGLGLFGCFKDKWLGFNPEFIGFGGEEGYIHEKYRKFSHKVICLPFLKWLHRFHDQITQTPYLNSLEERIRNYVIGWDELGMGIEDIQNHFTNFNISLEKNGAMKHITILPK